MELSGTLGCDRARPSGAAMRLKALCELSRRLASFSQVEALLPYVTQKACELCRAEECAVWLFDHEREGLYHRSHGQSGSALSRSAAKPVIAGQVLGPRTGTGVYEVAKDGGFDPAGNRAIDGPATNVASVPIRTSAGDIGEVRIGSPLEHPFTEGDLLLLEVVAEQVTVAYERVLREAHARREASIALCTMVGWVLVFVGFLCGLAATFAHLAWALPLSELPSRPSMRPGLLFTLVGGILIGAPRIHQFRKRSASQGATVARLRDDGIAPAVREAREGGSPPPSRQVTEWARRKQRGELYT